MRLSMSGLCETERLGDKAVVGVGVVRYGDE